MGVSDRMAQKTALMGIFSFLDDLVGAVELLKIAKADFTVYTPVPRHEIREAVGMKPSPVRYFTLFGAVFGIVSGVALAVFTVLQWKLIVSGKPVVPAVPFVVIAFEFCILLGVLVTVIGMLVTTRLPQRHIPPYYDPRFSVDRFGVLVRGIESNREELLELLKTAGAEEVREIEI